MNFPVGTLSNQRLEFFPAPFLSPAQAQAVLVFAWHNEKVVVSNITSRGWCIPSGRIEAGETSIQAAKREAMEEASITLKDPQYLGCFKISNGKTWWADAFVSQVDQIQKFTETEEVQDRTLVALSELPGIYYFWDPLIQAVFQYSFNSIYSKTTDR